MKETIIVPKEDYKSIINRSEANKPFWDNVGIKFLETFEIEPYLQSFIDKNHAKFGKTLDFCCGAGRNLLYLLKKEIDVYGFDFSEACVSFVREKSKEINGSFPSEERIKIATMYDIRNLYTQYSFDTLIASAVLYENIYKGFLVALSELDRVLMNDGTFYASIRTKAELELHKVEEIEKGNGYITLFHKYNNTTRIYFKPEFFVQLIEKIGFSLEGNSEEYEFGSRKNTKAMEFVFKKNPNKKSLEIIVERE